MSHDNPKPRDDFYLSGLVPELRARLEQKAKENERSPTREILFRLRKSLDADEAAAA